MCKVTYFRHKVCHHVWAVVTRPCAPYMGFLNCASFSGDRTKETPKVYKTESRPCPRCSGVPYDANHVRLVQRMGWGIKLGKGPDEDDCGLDVRFLGGCVVLMLPTPDTSHVSYQRVYEPSEDSFLLLDTLSGPSEQAFLHGRFASSAPLVVELGTGSGVVIAFAHAQAQHIFGTRHILTAGIDMNPHACRATVQTVAKASSDNPTTHGTYLSSCVGDLTTPLRDHQVDVLVFNPPYVPTDEMPVRPDGYVDEAPSFDDESYLLALSYAGGVDGMQTTKRLVGALPRVLSSRGCAYLLLCAQNKPDSVKASIRALGEGWIAETVSSSGKTAGWEKLQVVRIWRDTT